MKLIGLIGFAGSGKTTIAKAMTGYTRLAFADVLKRKAASALGIGVEELEARKAGFRPLLVELGKAGRAIDSMRWVTPVMDRVIELDENMVIDDVRYVNECDAIKARGGHLFFIHRPGVEAANDEEGKSILDVLAKYCSHAMPTIYNTTTPAEAAAAIMAAVGGE